MRTSNNFHLHDEWNDASFTWPLGVECLAAAAKEGSTASEGREEKRVEAAGEARLLTARKVGTDFSIIRDPKALRNDGWAHMNEDGNVDRKGVKQRVLLACLCMMLLIIVCTLHTVLTLPGNFTNFRLVLEPWM